jgi:hypothetical protein
VIVDFQIQRRKGVSVMSPALAIVVGTVAALLFTMLLSGLPSASETPKIPTTSAKKNSGSLKTNSLAADNPVYPQI